MRESQDPHAIPSFSVLDYALDDHVATLTLNRPERRNALSPQLVSELLAGLRHAGADPDVGAIVLTGAGGVFCSGADLTRVGGGEPGDDPVRGGFVELNRAFTTVGKPVVAKVRRYAIAGGLGLMCACHLALAEDTAFFATPEIDRGLFPMMIMASIFRTVPRRHGLELLLLGERIDAARAEAIGLINRAVPAARLDAEVDELARKLAAKPPNTMRLGLEAFHAQDALPYDDALPYLEQMLGRCLTEGDAREGLQAFLERREPVWRRLPR